MSLWCWVFTCSYAPLGTRSFALNWTWLNGPASVPCPAYGTQGYESASSYPGARAFSGCFTNDSGYVFAYAGMRSNYTVYADLWRFSMVSHLWTWISGGSGLGRSA